LVPRGLSGQDRHPLRRDRPGRPPDRGDFHHCGLGNQRPLPQPARPRRAQPRAG